MIRALLSTLSLLLICFVAFAQNGNYFLSHYAPTDEKIDFRSSAMTQDELGVIYFTNKSGVLEFDGKNWRIIEMPGATYTVSSNKKDVFVGGIFGFGKLSERKGSSRKYLPLMESSNIFSCHATTDFVYFCNEEQLFIYSLKTNSLEKTIQLKGPDSFTGIHAIGNQVYASTLNQGHMLIAGDRLNPPEFLFAQPQGIVFSLALNTSSTIVGTDENKIFIVTGNQTKEIVPSLADILAKSIILSGSLLHPELLAVGTLRKGVVFINPTTGEVVENIDYFSGLPDNEVFALMGDKNQGVWVAHEYGFTRIAPELPFRSFNHYDGLNGNLLCVRSHNGVLYAGTTLGLYALVTEETQSEVDPEETVQKGKRKILNFLNKNIRKKGEAAIPSPSDAKNQSKKTVITTQRYRYKKITGMEGKVTQLLPTNGKFLAVGLDGVFEVVGTVATPVIDEPVRSAFHSKIINQILVSTYGEQIKTFSLENNKWRETHLLDTLNDLVSYMFEDKLENIWLCARTKIYKVEFDESEIINMLAIPIENRSVDETVGVAYGSEVYVAASGEFKRYNGDDKFLRYDSLPGPHKYFASAGYFWFNDGHKWRTVDRKIQSLKLEWLGMFPSLRYLSPDEDNEGLWIITADNHLYKFYNTKAIKEVQRYPLFLREIKGQDVNLIQEQNIKLDQPENVVSFEFVQPNYVGLHTTEYRYQVKGLTNEWSTWSNLNNVVPFPYLAPGAYQLAVQSRDILGNESRVELINFEVLPPYWKQWWFYAMEFVFFSLLVFITVKLSANNERYRVVSQILSLLTVVMLIQFIQTGIDSILSFKSSPVVEFFIQVTIALIIFPVEGVVKKMIIKASEGKYKINLPKRAKKKDVTLQE